MSLWIESKHKQVEEEEEEEELERLGRIGRCCKLVRFFAVVLQVCFRFATARDSKGKCSLHP